MGNRAPVGRAAAAGPSPAAKRGCLDAQAPGEERFPQGRGTPSPGPAGRSPEPQAAQGGPLLSGHSARPAAARLLALTAFARRKPPSRGGHPARELLRPARPCSQEPEPPPRAAGARASWRRRPGRPPAPAPGALTGLCTPPPPAAQGLSRERTSRLKCLLLPRVPPLAPVVERIHYVRHWSN